MDQLSSGLSSLVGLSEGQDDSSNALINNEPPHSTTPQLVHQSTRTSIYRYQDKGIKILLGENLGDSQPHQWQITKLSNEQKVSRFLSTGCEGRKVLNIQPFDGHPVALYFKWCNGITLTEWIHKVQGTSGGSSTQLTSHSYNVNIPRRSQLDTPYGNMMDDNGGYNSFLPSASTLAVSRTIDDLNVRLRAAMAISKTLWDFHNGGVAHNNLSPDNIVLDTVEGSYVATLIDLSEGVIFNDITENREEIERSKKQKDLKALGVVLKQLFQGLDDESKIGVGGSTFQRIGNDNGSNSYSNTSTTLALTLSNGTNDAVETWDDATRRKRRQTLVAEVGGGLPIYLGSLISTLLLTGSEGGDFNSHYESAKDVYLDLKVMVENEKVYRQREVDDRMIWTRLGPPNMFYGRQVQMSMLMHLFQNVMMLGNQPAMATISGHPGTGKSALVNQMKKPIRENQGCFIEGKFLKSTHPDIVLCNSLDNFFGSIIEKRSRWENMYISLRWRIHDAIGSGNTALMDAIPNLRKLMDGKSSKESLSASQDDTSIGGRSSIEGSNYRLPFLLCKLIGAIACKAHPCVLFLDDLQWGDEMTLEVIRMIMIDPDVHHFLFIGAYRDNEVSLSHPLMKKLHDLKNQGISIMNISVGAIEKEFVNSLISEALCLPPTLSRPLTNVIHSKTGGIIMFLLRLMKSLNDEGLVWYSLSSRRWEFDLHKIRIKQISEDVVQHMTLAMTKLDANMQTGLRTAACLGLSFNYGILQKAKKEDDFEMEPFLDKCVEDGYIIGIDKGFAWTHDQVHQAAYELIPISQRESFHLLLGSRLLIKSSSSEQGDLLFYVVDNMNRGMRLLDDRGQKYELAYLNLRAGERAISSSAFYSASRYFITGLSLLEKNSWESHYSLTMALYDAASEALYVTGDFSRLATLAENPLKFARSFEDKLIVYNNLVRSFLVSGQYERGIDTCKQVLAQLGEDVPVQITPALFQSEVTRVKTKLDGLTDEQLLHLPKMTDPQKLAIMQFLNLLILQAYVARPDMSPIICCRMLETSIDHGVCNITPFAFGVYGAFLVSTTIPDVIGGYRMGRVAEELMKLLNAIEILPRLYTTIYAMINIWKDPFQASLGKHIEAFDVGTNKGDMEFGITNLFQYVNMAIYGCGENFDRLANNIHAYTKRAFQCQQTIAGKFLMVTHQLAIEFMGDKKDAYSLYFPGTTEESCFATAVQNKQPGVCRYIVQKKKYVAFWTGDMDAAAEMYELSKQFPLGSNAKQVNIIVGTFIDGLIAFYFARKNRSDKAKWAAIGEDIMTTLQKWEEGSTWNFKNKRLLLEAEYHFLNGNDHMALKCYTASIDAAHVHRFYHEEGLAYEKTATFLLRKSNHDGALDCFRNAKRCYEAWGAHAIASRVERAMVMVSPLCSDFS